MLTQNAVLMKTRFVTHVLLPQRDPTWEQSIRPAS